MTEPKSRTEEEGKSSEADMPDRKDDMVTGQAGVGPSKATVLARVLLAAALVLVVGLSYVYFVLPGKLPWSDSRERGWIGEAFDPTLPSFGLGDLSMTGLAGYEDEFPTWGNDDIFAVLLMGFDYNYPGKVIEGGGVPGRPDALMLLILPKDRMSATIVSIPRDTLVPLDSYGNEDRINALHRNSNPVRVMNAVYYLTGIFPDRWASVDFRGFVKVVDRLGGVDILVDENMAIWDDLSGRYAYIRKGLQHMDGETSLMYVRFRGDQMGDISRTSRQLRFIKALAAKAVQWNTVGEISGIISDIRDSFGTDLSEGEAMALGMRLLKIGVSNLDGFTLPGYFSGPYWKADLVLTRDLIDRSIRGIAEQSEQSIGLP